jgi:hypothetical protein
MAEVQFDPAGMLQIDLGRGVVQLQGASPRLVVPVAALVALCREAGNAALRDFGNRWGTELGARVAGRLGDGPANRSIQTWLEHLGGEWALAGLGALALERWGKALVLSVDGSPLGQDGDALLEALLGGALQRGASRDLKVVSLGRDDAVVRLVVLAPGAAQRARTWLEAGTSWGDVLARLHDSRGAE